MKNITVTAATDPGLRERVEKCISPHLSYACRFWPAHVQATDFDPELADDIKSFFDHERLFFWLEVLGLINVLGGAIPPLLIIAKWLKGHTGHEGASSVAVDVQRFIQVFGGMILHTFPARFPNSLRLASGRNINLTAVQTVISEHTRGVTSVSLSPDGTRIATGSYDRTVRMWDAATG